MWQLAPVVVLCLLPTAYLTNSPDPSTMIFGLMTSLWAFLLIDVSQGQLYSFAQFSNNALGIIGGVCVALAALVFINPPIPERQFKTYAHAFLQRCEASIDALRRGAPGASGSRGSIAARRAEWLELLGLCGLWARQLDSGRHPEDEQAKLGTFLDSLRSLAFRLEALEEACQRYPDQTLIEAASQRSCASALAGLGRLRQTLTAAARVDGADASTSSADDLRATLEPLHAEAHQKGAIPDRLHQVLILTGYYCALTDAVQECQARGAAIDWQKWDLAYF
jgi:hypothetical protein